MKKGAFYLTAFAVAVLDQTSKLLVAGHLSFGASTPLIGGALYVAPARNPGGAFGMFQAYAGLLTFITASVVLLIVAVSRRETGLPRLAWIALALQLGGAVGNLIDRVRLGYVFDFIDLRVWPVFNLADAAITAGMILLVYYLMFPGRLRTGGQASYPPAER